MKAGSAKVDITPDGPVWMQGMIRAHKSDGVHDHLYAHALVLSDGSMKESYAVVSLDLCELVRADGMAAREEIENRTGIPVHNIVITATHTHSGPATVGSLSPKESEYIKQLQGRIVESVEQAIKNLRPALVGVGCGKEGTISHYRRLLADDGRIVMNWEPYPEEKLLGPTGVVDADLGVIKAVDAETGSTICTLFNHTGHPNVMSGDNYKISADYVGKAQELVEEALGGVAMFVNGAQGTMDIDGLRDRDWEGVDRLGGKLADATLDLANKTEVAKDIPIRGAWHEFTMKRRQITPKELERAEKIIAETGGEVKPLADGVGDDYKAKLFIRLHGLQDQDVTVDQTCFAIGDTAFISIPGELFTEIGMRIKAKSPFAHTYLLGLANGHVGYIPTRVAIHLGGYEVDTRSMDDMTEELVVAKSLELLRRVKSLS
jgi:neutral ceramidase